ncbi:hypothetical protein V8F33_002611 [Rhypophila sp. PSN 637]
MPFSPLGDLDLQALIDIIRSPLVSSRSTTPTLRYNRHTQAMDVKEFGGALFNEYFINETHAILILKSCYGGPTNWSSIQWTKDESATNNTSTDTGPDVFTDLFGDSSPVASDPGTEVLGMTIFWILLALCLACVYHPLASSIHNRSRFRRYLHVSPLFCLLDVTYMAMQCWTVRARHGISWRRAAEVVVNHRLKVFFALPDLQGSPINLQRWDLPTVEGENPNASLSRTDPQERETVPGSSSTTDDVVNPSSVTTANQSPQPFPGLLVSRAQTDVLAQAALNIYVRLIADAINILLYAKICGFSGIRPWSLVAECLFDSWLLMELFLFIGYYAAPRNRPEDGAEIEYFSTLTAESDAMTPTTEASALTPLFVEVLASGLAIYNGIGVGRAIGSFCRGMLNWHFDHSLDYLIMVPFNIAWSAPHPFFFLATIVAIVPMIVWVFGLQIVSLFAMAVFIALPGCYSLVFAVIFGACKRLTQRYHRTFRISDSTLTIACARVLVAVICTHYIVFFLWFYDSQGTKKASWTELLGRRLG